MIVTDGSQTSIISEPIAAPVDSDAIRLDVAEPGPEMPPESWFTLLGKTTVRNVGIPTLTPVLPRPEVATGAAVVVAPGGGFLVEAMENEGWPQARWLADRGIAAFVLKYRLQPTPVDTEAFRAAVRARFAAAVVEPGQPRRLEVPTFGVADARAALRLVRRGSSAWGVDPQRVGYLGFSAGAMIGLGLVADRMDEATPDFLGTIYPSMDPVDVPEDAPPLFIAMASDDQLYGRQGYGLAQSWRLAERPVELHVYERGGHGFGMGLPGTTSQNMLEAFHAWMSCGGWLAPRSTEEGQSS
jgi:acetyl esterase/lipase